MLRAVLRVDIFFASLWPLVNLLTFGGDIWTKEAFKMMIPTRLNCIFLNLKASVGAVTNLVKGSLVVL